MPTFQPLRRDGARMVAISYSPLVFTVLDRTYKLALHRELNTVPGLKKAWLISDPVSGAKVAKVDAFYKGVPCSSRGLTQAAARDAAMFTLDRLLERVGSAAFIARAEALRQQYAAIAA